MKKLSIAEVREIVSRQERNVGVKYDALVEEFNNLCIDEDKFNEEARLQNIAKMATKDVTGILGKKLAQLMAWLPLTSEELFELHYIEQIGVQFKNIVKSGDINKSEVVQKAYEVADKYGIRSTVQQAIGKVVKKDQALYDELLNKQESVTEIFANKLAESIKPVEKKTEQDLFSKLDNFNF